MRTKRHPEWNIIPISALIATVAYCWCSSNTCARADDFFSGKVVEIQVGFGPGGGYDLYARTLARFLGVHIPGTPQIIVQNVPGAGGVKLLSGLYSIAPKDGTVIGTFDQNNALTSILYPGQTTVDMTKLGWIGSITKATDVCSAWYTSSIKSLHDLLRNPVSLGVTGRANTDYRYTAVVRNLLGANIRIVSGYQGSTETRLAMERGEIDGNCGESWSSVKSTASELLKARKLNILTQFAIEKHPDLPDVPLLLDEATTAEQKAALRLLFAPQLASRPYAVPPGVPAERLEILRAAFDATMRDPAFLAVAEMIQLEIAPVTGSEIEKSLGEMSRASPEVVAKLRQAVE